MFTLTLDDKTAARLQEIARQQNRTPNDVIRDLVEQVEPQLTGKNWALEMARMAEQDTNIKWSETASNLADKSRDILTEEFAEYLLKRNERTDE